MKLRLDKPDDCIQHHIQRLTTRDHFQQARLAVTQLFLPFSFADIARDADQTDDLPGRVPERNFRDGQPERLAVMADEIFVLLLNGQTTFHHQLLHGEKPVGGLSDEDIEIGLADQAGVIADIGRTAGCFVGEDKPAAAVLDRNEIGQLIQHPQRRQLLQRLRKVQRATAVHNGASQSLARIFQCFPRCFHRHLI
ncbi:hypothetical protein D3C73_663380 [compost metagenome]